MGGGVQMIETAWAAAPDDDMLPDANGVDMFLSGALDDSLFSDLNP